VRTVIISGSTDYRRFQAEAMKLRYGLRFPALDEMTGLAPKPGRRVAATGAAAGAPAELVAEVADLIRFKTKTLTAIGEQRSGV